MSYWVAANILFSAITYLFDFISNIIVAVHYGTRYAELLRVRECNDDCAYSKKAIAGFFWTLLCILLLSHTVNALIFKFKFNRQDDPFLNAYFLPLIHLWRMVDVIWRTLSLEKLKHVRPSKHMTGLFSMLGIAIEGMPLLVIQFSALQIFSTSSNSVPFKVSIAASFLAAGYCGGSSTLTLAENAKTTKAKLGIGASSALFTVFASLARCITLTILIVYVPEHSYAKAKSPHFRVQFHIVDTWGALFGAGSIVAYWIYYWILQSPKEVAKIGYLLSLKKCLASFVLAFMSFVAGPIYPMVNEARDRGELGTLRFQARLFGLCIVNIGADITASFISYRLGALPNAYIWPVSLGAAVGYLVSLAAYIAIDVHCGPIRVDSSCFENPEPIDESRYLDALSELEEVPIV